MIYMPEEIILLENAVKLKKKLAKLLYQKGYEQAKISKLLDITQPMVSNYLYSDERFSKQIHDYAHEIMGRLQDNKKISFSSCICFSEKKGGKYFLANKNELIDQEKQKIIDNMNDAFALLKGRNAKSIQPQVKMNLAMAASDAKDMDDVACFNNGIVIVDNMISSINGIRFGKSKHLAQLLLYLKQNMDVNAIMNIRYRKGFLGLKASELTSDYRLAKDEKNIDILLHKGGFGIEPCAYVLGKDAKDAAKKVIKLIGGKNRA
ncbi:hypothetical protein GF323_03425 [Candidatus Woesearchaeota archaeon]|nr:hypothetical protein [Candidatus Woesearchaeota archaeon]